MKDFKELLDSLEQQILILQAIHTHGIIYRPKQETSMSVLINSWQLPSGKKVMKHTK